MSSRIDRYILEMQYQGNSNHGVAGVAVHTNQGIQMMPTFGAEFAGAFCNYNQNAKGSQQYCDFQSNRMASTMQPQFAPQGRHYCKYNSPSGEVTMGLYRGPGHFSPGYGGSNMNQAFNNATLVESPIMEQNNSSCEAGPQSVTAGFNRANSVQQNGTEAHYKFR